MMANKFKKHLLTGLAVVASLGVLAGCDSIEAKLKSSEYDSKILELDGVTNNVLSEIYDSVIVSGDTNSKKVLDNVLLLLAESQFGTFYDTTEEKGLSSIVGNDTLLDEFINKHTVFQSDGVTDENARTRVKNFYNYLVRKINEAFYGKIGSTSNQVRSIFYEKKMYMSIKADLYDLGEIAEDDFKVVQVKGSDEYDEAPQYLNANYLTIYKDYIERSILPSIMRSELVSRYLINKNYGSLGRSTSRKVQYVALADNGDSKYSTATRDLVTAFANDVITVGTSIDDVDLDFLAELYKGYFDFTTMSAEKVTLVKKIYADAGFTPNDAANPTYWLQTTYGGYMVNYEKITDNRLTNDTSIESDFTNSGAYSKETGLLIKTQSLIATDKTTEGWFTNSDLSDLPSTVKTRLFKTTVANEVDGDEGTITNGEKDFGYYINGHYYLTRTGYQEDESIRNVPPYCIYDSSSSTWYIIRVDEAVKSAKLADGDDSYDKIHADDPLYREEIAHEVAGLLNDNDTYVSSANQYYVEQAAIAYHDDYVYDYFETTFPDLFD